MAFDAHTHLDAEAFAEDRDAVVARSRAAGVSSWVVAAADPAHWNRVQTVAEKHGAAWVLGIHPWWIDRLTDAEVDELLATLAQRRTPHGIGETGLDHARARTPEHRQRQRRSLVAHLTLARHRNVPVVLHMVRAVAPLLQVLTEHRLPAAGGMIHAWQADAQHVATAIDLGLHLSFGSAILRLPRAQHALQRCPLDRLLLETDAPDQPVVPGARGEPADLITIARVAAELRGEPLTTVLNATHDNAARLFPMVAQGGRPPTSG